MKASRAGDSSTAKITGGEVFLVIGLFSLLGIVVAVDYFRENLPGDIREWGNGLPLTWTSPQGRSRGRAHYDTQRPRQHQQTPSDDAQIRLWARRMPAGMRRSSEVADRVGVEIVKNGDGYEIRRSEPGTGDSRISLDLDVAVPKKAALTIRNEKGDITVADMGRPVSLTNGTGNIEVREQPATLISTRGKATSKFPIPMATSRFRTRRDINVSGATGGLTIDGNSTDYPRGQSGQRRALHSRRIDLTLSQLAVIWRLDRAALNL